MLHIAHFANRCVCAFDNFLLEQKFRSFEAMCDAAREHIPADQPQARNRFIGRGTMDERRIAVDLCVFLD
jgi:hypothetical protein